MENFYAHQHKNKARTWVLMMTVLGITIALGWILSQIFGNPNILVGFVVMSILMNVVSYWFSDKIVIRMTKAKPVTREQMPDLYNMTQNLAITAGLPMPKLYVIDDPAPNAFATGRNKDHAAVAVTTGLLQILDRAELEGVIAHELAHIGNNDMLISTVAVVLVGVITLVSDFLLRSTMFGGGQGEKSGGPITLIIGLILAVVMPMIGTILRMSISRKREFLADASGALLTRHPDGLASALEKIHAYGRKMKTANHATAHLFIANPFGGKRVGTYVNRLFMTHPPAHERIQILRSKK